MNLRSYIEMCRTILIISFIYSFTLAGGQAGPPEMARAEEQLQILFQRLYADSVTDREGVLEEIRRIMPAALSMDGSLKYPWSRLDRIGVVTSDDQQVRIFTWHVAEDPDHYRYFGYIQVARRRDKVEVFELKDRLKDQRTEKELEQSTDRWHGKLYYQIITTRHQRNTFYTLLGLDFNNAHSNIKTVETMEIRRNRPRFTEEMFFDGKQQVDRMVFEYSSQASISVRYDRQLKMITFDHLVPFHPVYSGDHRFYGPDGSFDGLAFTDGRWVYRDDVDARNRN